jgi:hypothetical protein
MKPSILFLLSLAVLSAPSVAPAQATGKEAIRIVGRDRGADYLPRMLHLFGPGGVPQPAVWRVVARDAKGAVREFYVSKGAIISEGIIPPAKANGISGTPLPMHRLNIDSKEAFEKAEVAARTAKVGFDHLNYQLRCLELSTNAAWFIALEDAQGGRVGEVCVGASTGTIISQNWFRQPLAVAGKPLPPTAPPPQPGLWDRTKEGLNRGATGVRHGVGNAAGWVQQKVTPPPAVPPPPVRYVTPPAR